MDERTVHLFPLSIEIPEDWGRYVDEPLTDKELEKLRQSINCQSPYGDIEWQMRVAKELGLESTIRPRGRPGKGTDNGKKK